jgi:hypothetical protein
MLNEAQESSQEQLMAAIVAPEGIVGESNRSECASVSVCAAGKGQQNVGRFEVVFQRKLQPSGGTMYAEEADQEKHNGHNWKPLREHDYIGLSDVSSSSSSSFLHNVVQQQRGGGGEKVVREEEEEEELNLNLGATELRLGPLPNHHLLLESGRRIAKEGGVEGGGSSSLKRSGSAAELVPGYCGSDNARECQGARDEESLRLGIGLVPKRDDAAAADSGGRSTDKTLMGRGGGQQQQPNNLQERPKQELISMQESDLPEMMMHQGGTAARGGAAASNSVTNPRISADQRYPQEPPRYVAESMLADLHRSGIMQEFMERKHMMRQGGGGGGEKNGHFWLGGNSEPPHHLPHSSSCPQEPLAAGGGSSRSAALCPPPHSKNGMGGAKRGFSEVIGNSLLVESRRSGGPYPPPPDGRNGFADGGATVGGRCSAHANSGRSNSAVEISQQQQKHHAAPPPSAMYPCSNPKPSPTGNGSFGAFHSQQQQQQPPPAAPRGGLPLMSNNRGVEMNGGVTGNNLESNPKAWDSSQLKNLHQEATSEIISKHPSPDTGSAAPVKDAAVPTTAPPPRQSQVIGWPPVRNFRRQQLPRPAPQPTSTVSPPKPPATSGSPSQISLLVKVYMDGRPIGRKVNLTINNSYDKLKSAVEDMFQQYIRQPGGPQSSTAGDTGISSSSCGQKLNLLHSSKYVLTYMDHEGDLMLVGGDVPWEDFTTNVQRLRITKGDDIG